ncbi:MAG TPA: hypothetical protein VGN34_17360 [Ktedonobacteraceae bacterium]
MEQIQDVVERVAVLLPQACSIEARSTSDTLFRNVLRSVDNEDPAFLRILAHASRLAGQIHAITRRTREVDHILQHFQEMAGIARVLGDQTFLNMRSRIRGIYCAVVARKRRPLPCSNMRVNVHIWLMQQRVGIMQRVLIDDAEGIGQRLDEEIQAAVEAYKDPWQEAVIPTSPVQFANVVDTVNIVAKVEAL